MNINDLTIKQAKELVALFNAGMCQANFSALGIGESTFLTNFSAWEIGKSYLIRTVTMIDTGKLVAVTEHELVLEDAAWIPDTGRFADAVKKATFEEVEPFPDGRIIVGRGAIIDAVIIEKSPRSQK